MGRKKKEVSAAPVRPESLALLKVKDIMNTRPRTVNPDTSIEGLLERLLNQIESCFPVVDREKKLLGIVTESDVLQVLQIPLRHATVGPAMVSQAMKRSASTVGEIMTKRPVTVGPEMTVQETLNLMAAHKLRHLPVVKNEKLIGLICLRNIIELHRFFR